MPDRIIDIAEAAAGLSVRHSQLVIASNGQETLVPLDELAALIVSHPAVHYSQAVLSGICSRNGAFIVCNEKHMPIGMVLSLDGHSSQAERFAAQASASAPTNKQLWKQIVRAKILAQDDLLSEVTGSTSGLRRLAQRVRSGDTGNLEAQASRKYWPALFGQDFRRDRNLDDVNKLLNYGYAILRAVVARAITSSGLHPSLGIHHHNRYDTYCLASDLMEPFRSLVDRAALTIQREQGTDLFLDKTSKAALIKALTDKRFNVGREERGLFDLATRMTSSLAAIYLGSGKKLFLP